MQPDPFGNLRDWGPVLDLVCQLADHSELSECQPGLTRILAYRDNWRLREETLKRIGVIEKPGEALVRQVLRLIVDENLYYEVRIMACETVAEWLNNDRTPFSADTRARLAAQVAGQLAIPQPPIFADALMKLESCRRTRFGSGKPVEDSVKITQPLRERERLVQAC